MSPGLPLPPDGLDLGLDMIESQCAATCDPSESCQRPSSLRTFYILTVRPDFWDTNQSGHAASATILTSLPCSSMALKGHKDPACGHGVQVMSTC